MHHLRRNIGIVGQDNVLFITSIKEKIMYGMGQGHLPETTDEEIWAICDKANATEFINSFPNKLYTNVGERGVKLSGGQKQRIAIARAACCASRSCCCSTRRRRRSTPSRRRRSRRRPTA